MPHYTTYWRDDQATANHGEPIDYAASEQFAKLKKGDTLWIVNIQSGTGAFRLIGKLSVAAVVDEKGASQRFPGQELYESSHYACAPKGREERACAIPIDHYANQIRFEGPSPTLELRDGKVYVQQVRSLRTLTPDTADLFEDIWLDFKGPLKVPSASDYVRAFQALSRHIKPIHRNLLSTQYASHGRQTPARFLAATVCDGKLGKTNLFYGGLAKRLCKRLDVEPSRRRDGSPRWWNILASGWEGPDGFVWKMRPEVAEALEILGWVQPGAMPPPPTPLEGEERIPPTLYSEGRARQLLVNAYERDPKARKACIAHYSCKCQICDFDFGQAYGTLGEGFIHVHHRVPLATIAKTYTVDPIKDMIPVCPNCHAMLHCGPEPPSVEELGAIVQSRT
jgi:5-methylcytosine-specific restriction protein A